MVTTTHPKGHWFVIADAGEARLWCGNVVPPGRYHVVSMAHIAPEAMDHEHGRPSPRTGKTGDTAQSHESEEQWRRCAKQVAAWVEDQMDQRRLETVVLFASPRLLGALRATTGLIADPRVETHEADLTGLDSRALRDHPKIRHLLEPAPKPIPI